MTPGIILQRVVSEAELYQICTAHLADLESLASAFRQWLNDHPDYLDESL